VNDPGRINDKSSIGPTNIDGAQPDHRTDGENPRPDVEVEAARRRQAWRESTQYARSRRIERGVAGSVVLIAGLAVLAAWLYYGRHASRNELILIPSAAAFFWLYFGFAYVLASRRRLNREFRDAWIINQSHQDLKEAERKVAENGSSDFAELWDVTQKRLDYYHRIATSQSEKSFFYGQMAAVAGFAAIVVAALVAGFARSTTASIVAGLTGATGGGLGAYIGATFMKSQDLTSAQLRAYFLQPLEFSKYLAAERLAQQISVEKRDAAIINIINSIAKSSDFVDPGNDKVKQE
jgi:hypothetical protein